MGGIAAQTAFLVLADISYRRANLEHAAASVTNIINGALLVALLSLALLAAIGPPVALFGVHPASMAVLALYVYGLKLASATREAPGWRPVLTVETCEDHPDAAAEDGPAPWLKWVGFIASAAVVGFAGWLVGCPASGWCSTPGCPRPWSAPSSRPSRRRCRSW